MSITPLLDRIGNYEAMFRPITHIPLHPDDYYGLSDKQRKEIEDMYGVPVLELGEFAARQREEGE